MSRSVPLRSSPAPSIPNNGNGRTARLESSAGGLTAVTVRPRHRLSLASRMAWFDDLVGLHIGSVTLLAGSPGARKSGLATQLAASLAADGIRSLTILTEETPDRLRDRVTLMTRRWPESQRVLANMEVESSMLDLQQLPRFVLQQVLCPGGRYSGVQLVILDSIQGSGLPANATEQYGGLYEATRLLAAANISTLLLGHVTKRSQIAGPKTLEHSADVTLRLERIGDHRLLGITKNRFGAENCRGFPLQIEKATTLLIPSPHTSAVIGKTKSFVTREAGLVELQAAVSLPAPGEQPRTQSPGLPRHRVQQLVECLGRMQIAGLDQLNLHLSAMLAAELRFRSWMTAALGISVIASCVRRPVPSDFVVCGEVDLARELRPLPRGVLDQLIEAILEGALAPPMRLIVPAASYDEMPSVTTLKITPCGSLDEVAKRAWPDLGGAR